MEPHKPQTEAEKKRIEEAGGVVVWYGAWRVNGVLSVARAIGDRKLKEWVIGDPDVASFDLDGTEEYLIVACDGLWDVMDEDKVSFPILYSPTLHRSRLHRHVTICCAQLFKSLVYQMP